MSEVTLLAPLQTAVVPMQIKIAPEAASILRAMPLPVYTSRQVIIQVNMPSACANSLYQVSHKLWGAAW